MSPSQLNSLMQTIFSRSNLLKVVVNRSRPSKRRRGAMASGRLLGIPHPQLPITDLPTPLSHIKVSYYQTHPASIPSLDKIAKTTPGYWEFFLVPSQGADLMTHLLAITHDIRPLLSGEEEWSLNTYRPAEYPLSMAPLCCPTPRTGSCHSLLLSSPYPFRLLYESSTLPFTCPHTFYFPATGSRLDKKTRHWRPPLSE